MRVDVHLASIRPEVICGNCNLHQHFGIIMATEAMAFFLFWLPGIVLVVGIISFLLKKELQQKKIGLATSMLCFLLLLASPWTLPDSDSSSFGHLLGSLIGPLVLTLTGVYNIIFSIQPGTTQYSKNDRIIGFILFIVGLSWLIAYHWIAYTPTYDNAVNQYWILFFSTLFLLSPVLFFSFGILVSILGHNRKHVVWTMLLFGFVAFQFLIGSMVLDGSSLTSVEFSNYLSITILEVSGYAIGLLLAASVFSAIITLYESRIPMMPQLDPPNAEELKYAREIIKLHLEGGGEDE